MKANIHKALTANRLGDGLVVFLSDTGDWSGKIDLAAVATNEKALSVLECSGERATTLRQVVGPYLIDVEIENGEVKPMVLRERIRAYGPTVHFHPNG